MSRGVWVIVVALVASLATLIYVPFVPHHTDVHMTKHVMNKKLEILNKYDDVRVIKYLSGEDAINAIRGLHWHPGKIVDIEDAVVAVYNDGSILWLALFSNSTIAKRLEERMINAILKAQGRIPYLKPIPHEGFYIIPDVRGPYHLLWQEGRCLIWLQLGEEGMKLFKAIYSFYKPVCLGG